MPKRFYRKHLRHQPDYNMEQLNIKKKILIFVPGGVGGAERMTLTIGKMLPREKFEVKFVVIGRLRNIYNIMPEGYEADCIPVFNKYAFSTLRIWWKIIREKPDFIFTSQVAYNPRVIIAAKLAGCKVIARSSGMLSNYPKAKFLKVRLTYPYADLLVAQQDDMREEMIRLLNVEPQKVRTIHNPLDCQHIDSLSSAPSPYLEKGHVNFVQAARVNHSKAQDIGIKAFAIVQKNIPKAHFYVVGGYDEKSEYYKSLCKLVAALHLQDNIHFVGYDKNPFRWVKNADCFVFPSRAEGLPNALIEASYLGVPCVATRCLNIIDEIIKNGKNGYVVEVDDMECLAQAMKDAIKLKSCAMFYKPGTPEEITNLFA